MKTNLELKQKSGIYRIRCLSNKKLYIGSAVDLYNRCCCHIKELDGMYHHSIKLQRAWNKYGKVNFIFEIVEECNAAKCIEREQHYLDTILFASAGDSRFDKLGYNICRIAGNSLGYRHTEKTRQLMSEIKSKRYIGSGNPNFGKKASQSTITKLRMAAAKLTITEVQEIRNLLKMGITQREIADRFGVRQQAISKIHTGQRWSNV